MQSLTQVYRITVYADGKLEQRLVERFLQLGAKGYTAVDGRGSGEKQVVQSLFGRSQISRIEVLVHGKVAQKIVDYLNREIIHTEAVTACVEEVKVFRGEHF